MNIRMNKNKVIGYLTGAMLLVVAACGGTPEPAENALTSSEVAQTSQLIQGRLSGAVYDTLPDSLDGFTTESSRILVGQVVEIRGNNGYVDIDESTLSEHEGGEKTVLGELPREQVAELTTLLERGELPPPIEVGFDSSLATWKTVDLVVDVESQVASDGLTNGEEQTVVIGVSIPAGAGLDDLEGYRKIGRAAFFVDRSAVFGGAEGVQMDGMLVGSLSDADEITAMPFLEHEFADVWLEEEPSLETLIDSQKVAR